MGSQSWKHFLLKKVCLVLGIFEFLSAYACWTAPALPPHVPSVVQRDPSVRVLFVVYLLTLGLQRLSYGFSKDNNLMQVLALWLTHFVEAFLWWTLAMLNTSLTFMGVMQEVVTLRWGVQPLLALIGVPVLLLVMMYLSTDTFVKKKKI